MCFFGDSTGTCSSSSILYVFRANQPVRMTIVRTNNSRVQKDLTVEASSTHPMYQTSVALHLENLGKIARKLLAVQEQSALLPQVTSTNDV
jgi:hypothetical protein